jgi:hypothetical protein
MKFVLLLAAAAPLVGAAHPRLPEPAVSVTPENFPRAESDLYFASAVKDGGLGKFLHRRQPTALDRQTVTRINRDTLYSGAVFDLDAGPATITLPNAGGRFMSMQVIDDLRRRRSHARQERHRNALRRRRDPHPGRSQRSEGRRCGSRAAGRDQGQPTRRAGRV